MYICQIIDDLFFSALTDTKFQLAEQKQGGFGSGVFSSSGRGAASRRSVTRFLKSP